MIFWKVADYHLTFPNPDTIAAIGDLGQVTSAFEICTVGGSQTPALGNLMSFQTLMAGDIFFGYILDQGLSSILCAGKDWTLQLS